MEQIFFELMGCLFSSKGGDAMMAWVQFIPAILSAAGSIYGSIEEGRKRREMAKERAKWNAENEAWYNKEYNEDYTKRADALNLLRRVREEGDRSRLLDEGKQVITGGTHAAQLAAQEKRNRAMANLYSNLAAQGAYHKDRVQQRYLDRKQRLEELHYDDMGQSAASSNNLFYNGLAGVAGSDWAGMLSGGQQRAVGGVQRPQGASVVPGLHAKAHREGQDLIGTPEVIKNKINQL